MRARPLRPLRRALALASVLAAALLGCNLVFGIEDQGVRPVPEDAGADGDEGVHELEACTRDQDCVAPNGCYTPHCDTVLGACTYALCEAKDRTCTIGTCDTRTFPCSGEQAYGFQATTYDIPGATSGCGASPESCVAAAFPFLLVGTRDDVVALRTDNLIRTTADKVTVTDLGTKPQQLVASGRRIWVLGAVQGQTPPYVLPIASIDVPSDPTVTALHARTALVRYPFPSAQGFPAPNGALFVTHNDAAQGFPTAIVSAPITSEASFGLANAADAGSLDGGVATTSGTITMYRASAPAGSSLVAASGSRLVAYRPGAVFNLLDGAGTAGAALRPDLPLQTPLLPIGPVRFAQGPDGVVVMNAPIAADPPAPAPPALPDCNCQSHERLQWVLPSAIATTTDVNQVLDHAVYVNPQAAGGACHVCTGDYVRFPSLATWIDRRTVLTAAAFGTTPAMRTVTDVRLLGRDPFDGYPKRRAQTKATDSPSGNFVTDRVALTSSNGIGYLVLADGQGNDVSVSIFDPRCDAR
ncbi:hypothetical protein BH11MYX4_BH11MYX4_35970 [soil metagenome]